METTSNNPEQNTIQKTPLSQKGLVLFVNYGIIITPIVLFLLFMYLLIFFYLRTPSNQPVIPLTTKALITLTPQPQASPILPTVDLNPQVNTGWVPIHFSEKDFGSTPFTKTLLPDGAIQYISMTNTPGRPQEIIVKDGIVIFHRIPVFNVPLSKYLSYYGYPQYVATNLHFWGPNAVTYIYPSEGFAFTANTAMQLTYEQISFQPGPIEQFEQYDSDIDGAIQKY
jgi:hypothetical protein